MIEIVRIGGAIGVRTRGADHGLYVRPDEVNQLVHDLLDAAGMELAVTCRPKGEPKYSTDIPRGGVTNES